VVLEGVLETEITPQAMEPARSTGSAVCAAQGTVHRCVCYNGKSISSSICLWPD